MKMTIDSIEERRKHVEQKLSYMGLSLRAWSLENGFTPSMVRSVVKGEAACRFGVSHRIAVLLGFKEGEIPAKKATKKTGKTGIKK
jgi:gp16 family phage-associated protein